jgi:hypothetical protein
MSHGDVLWIKKFSRKRLGMFLSWMGEKEGLQDKKPPIPKSRNWFTFLVWNGDFNTMK